MKKLVLLLMCLCMVGCRADNTDSVSVGTMSETTVETTIATAETTTVPETTTETTTTTAETTTVPETTIVTTTTTVETTTVPETTTETTTTTAETTTVPETTAVTTTTKAETTTVAATTTVETTAETEAVDGYDVIEIEGKRYRLTFEDEFEGADLDVSKWERCPEWPRQDLNNQWDNDMSYLDGNGNLIIEMSYDEEADKYLSGAVRSKGKFEQTYGYFEIRCTVNTIPGYWTAFWLMGETVGGTSKGGVDGTEIDIMESAFYETGEIQNTLNWDGYGVFHKYDGKRTVTDVYDGDYHTFSVLWTDEEYVFFIDGEESWRTDAEKALGTCEAPLYIKVTSEMGGWTSVKLTPENLPDYMKVDYVRAYAAE
ncbi:MAG: glycoside hydrolase family 16 protein [Oscillospiraceae bacterium]|nr:glycoside hydrolase family 16 protein [Oscillospiraceae bacterium]